MNRERNPLSPFCLLWIGTFWLLSCTGGSWIDDPKPASSERSPLIDWSSSTLAEGVKWHSSLGFDPRFGSGQSYNAVEVDLQQADVKVEFLWFFNRTALLSMIANQVGAIAAVNGTYLGVDDQFFKSRDSTHQSIIAPEDDPRRWSYEGALYYDRAGRLGIVAGNPSLYEKMGWPGIMSAGPLLIDGHRLTGISPPERPSHEQTRHPRTAVALSDGGQRLILLTVDGRAEEAAGLTTPELTLLFREEFAAESALNLDGGGTTTMWVRNEARGAVVNYPSDNARFNHHGERWTGQAIVILPGKRQESRDLAGPELLCTASFDSRGTGEEEPERYIYLGDQLDGIMDMPAEQNFTISVWIRPKETEDNTLTLFNKRIADTSGGGTSRGYELSIRPDGRLSGVLDNGLKAVALVGDRRVEPGQWSHVALTLNGESARLMLNGQIETVVESPALLEGFDNRHFLTAGARREWAREDHRGRTYPHSPWGQAKFSFHADPFLGEMDEFQVWHRALSESELQRLAGGKVGADSIPVATGSLVSFWGFDDPEGSIAEDRTGRVHGTYRGEIGRICR